MDPFSIATGCFGLVAAIAQLSVSVTRFVKAVRSARQDLDAVSRELASLRTILELLADDITDNSSLPETLQKQISGIISNCTQVLEEIRLTLEKNDTAASWITGGKDDVTKLRLSLEAHKSALEIALDMIQLSISKSIKADTTVIRNDTEEIKQDTAQILIQIERLRAQLPQDPEDLSVNIMLERYLSDLTSYAESVKSDDSVQKEEDTSAWPVQTGRGVDTTPKDPGLIAEDDSPQMLPKQKNLSPFELEASIDSNNGNWILGETFQTRSFSTIKFARNAVTSQSDLVRVTPGPSVAEDEIAEYKFKAGFEASVLQYLHHPYICEFMDVAETNDFFYLFFEYYDGNMTDLIKTHGRFEENEARKFVRQIASALDYCHKNNIVHANFKTEDIQLTKGGDVRIIDFFYSNHLSPRGMLWKPWRSLEYAAPEVVEKQKLVGAKIDVWSLGVVLCVLVTKSFPFKASTEQETEAKILSAAPEVPSWLSAECKDLISRMLVKPPDQRASLNEVISHPWMTKGYSGPVESYMPNRAPLSLPLDQAVIQRVSSGGFGFGSPQKITIQLEEIIQFQECGRPRRLYTDESYQIPSMDVLHNQSSSPYGGGRNSGQTPLPEPTVEAGLPELGSHAIVSMYYLVREKMERDQTKRVR